MKRILWWSGLILGLILGLVMLGLAAGLSHLRQKPSEAYWIVYTDEDNGLKQLYLTTPQGTLTRHISQNSFNNEYAQWSPDGQWLFFSKSDKEVVYYPSPLYGQRINGTQQKMIAYPSIEGLTLTWTTDGQWLYVRGFGSDINSGYDIWRMRPDGSHAQNLTSQLPLNETIIGLSANDTWIIFTSNNADESDIWRMRPDGTQAENLTQTPNQDERYVALSPDKQWISYTLDNQSMSDIYRLSVNGGQPIAVTQTPDIDEGVPLWSPDSQWLFFIARTRTSPVFYIYRVHVAGQLPPEQLTQNANYGFIGWSPDGQWLWLEQYNQIGNLYRMRPDGSDPQNLTQSDYSTCCYQTAPDGQWLYFAEFMSRSDFNLYRVRVDGSQKQLIIKIKRGDNFHLDYNLSPAYDYPLAVGRWGIVGGGLVLSVLGLGVWQWRKRRA